MLLGPPGAGKGTQAARIVERLNILSVSSGDLFRDHQQRDTELGRLTRSYMERGVLVPDDVTIDMVTEWIGGHEGKGGFLLDGFPRTLAQAEALDKALEGKSGIDRALYINVSEGELIRRLSGRLLCRSCQTPYSRPPASAKAPDRCARCGGELFQRDDDNPDAVGTRIQEYMEKTSPLVERYRKAGVLREVNGEQSVQEVNRALIDALG